MGGPVDPSSVVVYAKSTHRVYQAYKYIAPVAIIATDGDRSIAIPCAAAFVALYLLSWHSQRLCEEKNVKILANLNEPMRLSALKIFTLAIALGLTWSVKHGFLEEGLALAAVGFLIVGPLIIFPNQEDDRCKCGLKIKHGDLSMNPPKKTS